MVKLTELDAIEGNYFNKSNYTPVDVERVFPVTYLNGYRGTLEETLEIAMKDVEKTMKRYDLVKRLGINGFRIKEYQEKDRGIIVEYELVKFSIPKTQNF